MHNNVCVCVCVLVPQAVGSPRLPFITDTHSLILFFSDKPQAGEQECAWNVICGFSWDLI